jgi:riboflavin synthase
VTIEMFTGIIQQIGKVATLARNQGGARLEIEGLTFEPPAERGESVAVNGVCLTALEPSSSRFTADLSDETLRLTNLGSLEAGALVNIERALRFGDRISGHIVQGHVDTTGVVESINPEGNFATYRWSYPAEFAPLVISKGSISVDGISLTIVDPDASGFSVALIPETLARTNLQASRVGDRVNLEFDMMAKYVQHLAAPYLEAPNR